MRRMPEFLPARAGRVAKSGADRVVTAITLLARIRRVAVAARARTRSFVGARHRATDVAAVVSENQRGNPRRACGVETGEVAAGQLGAQAVLARRVCLELENVDAGIGAVGGATAVSRGCLHAFLSGKAIAEAYSGRVREQQLDALTGWQDSAGR